MPACYGGTAGSWTWPAPGLPLPAARSAPPLPAPRPATGREPARRLLPGMGARGQQTLGVRGRAQRAPMGQAEGLPTEIRVTCPHTANRRASSTCYTPRPADGWYQADRRLAAPDQGTRRCLPSQLRWFNRPALVARSSAPPKKRATAVGGRGADPSGGSARPTPTRSSPTGSFEQATQWPSAPVTSRRAGDPRPLPLHRWACPPGSAKGPARGPLCLCAAGPVHPIRSLGPVRAAPPRSRGPRPGCHRPDSDQIPGRYGRCQRHANFDPRGNAAGRRLPRSVAKCRQTLENR